MKSALLRASAVLALALALAAGPTLAQTRTLAPLLHDDEAVVVSDHQVRTVHGPLRYQARVGRLPIRDEATGQVRGYAGFIAYVVPGRPDRPLTFLWNGGPIASSLLVHTEMFGPRRLTAAGMVDNAETLLADSDLVFFDPVGTGFGRPQGNDGGEFYSTLGDFAETAEFVRAYSARFGAARQPLFLGGESYGTWRVGGTAELLEQRGIRVAGALLISGGVPGSLMPPAFQDAMYVPARTAAAFALGRLDPALLQDRARTLAEVAAWVRDTYLPALEQRAQLAPAQRAAIVGQLARFTGVQPAQIDPTTLVMSNRDYLRGLYPGQPDKVLDTYDMRIVGPVPEPVPDRAAILARYLREELGYATDLPYLDLERGYLPVPGPAPESPGQRWDYNHVELTPEVIARMQAGGGPPLSQPWLQRAMRADPGLRVFVAAGRYDSLNMCEGNLAMSARLEPALAARFTHRCYEGGHMMYRDAETREQLADDVARFILDRK